MRGGGGESLDGGPDYSVFRRKDQVTPSEGGSLMRTQREAFCCHGGGLSGEN